jgi:UDP-3-O-[3-hydroxymyristoyl] glucosamine N-acyltransferase
VSHAAAVSQTLGELAVRFGCTLRGDPQIRIASVATLESGGGDAIGFLVNPAYLAALHATGLGAVVLAPRHVAESTVPVLQHSNPHAVFARIAAQLHPRVPRVPGVHATAVVDASARVDASAEVGAFAVIGADALVGPRCRIGAHSIIGAAASVAADSELRERVTLCAGSHLGSRCLVHPGAVIGADGFGNARDEGRWIKVPQLGGVRIGDDVEIGANTTIDRGALGDTVIEEGVRLDNQIQIAHNVVIGAHTAIAACTGIAGSTRIGRRCMIGGGTGIGGQLQIGDDIVIAGFGMVTHSLAKPGMYSSVLPVEEVRLWRRIVGRIKRLDALVARVSRVEAATGVAAAGQDNDNS